MEYAAIILYYRLGEQIRDTISSLIKQTHPPTEVILVDNASGDGVIENLEPIDGVTVLSMPQNLGYAAAMNAAASRLVDRYPTVLFLTHEVIMEQDCVEMMARALKDDAVGAVGPSLRLASSGTTWSTGGYLTRLGDVRHHNKPVDAAAVDWLDGACILVRSEIFKTVSGFDEDYFLYWEDADLSLRIARAGSSVRCALGANAYQDTEKTPVYWRTRNQILLWRKHRAIGFWLASILVALLKLVLIDLLQGSFAQGHARAWGIADGISGHLAERPFRMRREGPRRLW